MVRLINDNLKSQWYTECVILTFNTSYLGQDISVRFEKSSVNYSVYK